MITDTLARQIADALKRADLIRVSTLRLLSSALHNEKIAKMHDLTQEEEIAIVRRELKRREEAVEAYKKGGRQDSAEKEEKEAEILKEFLPEQMDESELSDLVNRVIEESDSKDFGRIMGEIMKQVAGKADGRLISEIVRKRLS